MCARAHRSRESCALALLLLPPDNANAAAAYVKGTRTLFSTSAWNSSLLSTLYTGACARSSPAPPPHTHTHTHTCRSGTFRDVNGQVYRPHVVRLGSEEALSEEARQVWVEQMAGQLLAHSMTSYVAERSAAQGAWRQCQARLQNVAETLMVCSAVLWVQIARAHRMRCRCQSIVLLCLPC